MSSILIEAPINPTTCRHETLEELGRDRGATYQRCPVCGSIVIAQRGHRWIIRPTDEMGPLSF